MPMLERIAGNRELKQDLKTALGSGGSPTAFCWWGAGLRCRLCRALPSGGLSVPQWWPPCRGGSARAGYRIHCGAWGGGFRPDQGGSHPGCAAEYPEISLSSDAEGRVLFIYGAQNLNGASANAMLKIMEEPPEGVMFLLTASSAAAVLPTIRSRCAAYTMHRCRPKNVPLPCAQHNRS